MRKTALLAALAIAPLLGVPVAHADATTVEEIAYIQTLQDRGIPILTEDHAIEGGHLICAAFDEGATFPQVVEVLHDNSGLSLGDTGYLIGASVAAFCPQYEDIVNDAAAA